jgi:hypothetical protein
MGVKPDCVGDTDHMAQVFRCVASPMSEEVPSRAKLFQR